MAYQTLRRRFILLLGSATTDTYETVVIIKVAPDLLN
jgi:hypothetical protein